ncbi:MAG: PilZ domain-containing protein [Sphingomonadaceae bacterium]|nr:PilZ domain-containing protein [Sphingomonadaceae bacterium]
MIDEGDARGRVSTRMSGAITVGRRRSTVAVRNISTGGAMIELPSPPEEGTRIRFETETTGKLDARVVWVIGNRCGLVFERSAAKPARREAATA